MKRNMDLIRHLLLQLEELPEGPLYMLSPPYKGEFKPAGCNDDEVAAHLVMLRDAGFIEAPPRGQPMIGVGFSRLSWPGRDFVDSVRDNKIWSRTKDGATAAGGWTIDLLVDLAKGFAKKQIEERTGIKL